MHLLKLTVILTYIFIACGTENEMNNHNKGQHFLPRSRHNGRLPPYAVQMEPITHYSQRDPLDNPLSESKIGIQSEYYKESPFNHYPTEPEPIIEIIIKESNETLPTSVLPIPSPTLKSKVEPVQVFYVKYEKKQEYGDNKARVVYDTPIAALTPVEDHEEIKTEISEVQESSAKAVQAVTPSPSELSTTLRAVIRPDSEIYHSENSALRVTFGTSQVPPNNHNKRSDKESSDEVISNKPLVLPPPGSLKRPHGPFAPIQPIPSHTPPTFSQQQIVNSFSPQQFLSTTNPSQILPNFSLQPQFHQSILPYTRNQYQQFNSNKKPQQSRSPITIQGLPEVQQRIPFNTFIVPHHININNQQPEQLHLHKNPQIQNFKQQLSLNESPSNFHFDLQLRYKQQSEQERQRYVDQERIFEQRQQEQQRLQNLQRQQNQQILEQQRYFEQQKLQKQQEHQRQYENKILEQRRKFEQEQQKLHLQQQQQQQEPQGHQQYNFKKIQDPGPHSLDLPQKQLGGEILKAIPKLEQHYAIRENPLHPGPFPPDAQYADIVQTSNQFTGSLQKNLAQQSHQLQFPYAQNSNQNSNVLKQHQQQEQREKQQPQPLHQTQQSLFSQNLPILQQQIPPNININQNKKNYATMTTNTSVISKKYTVSTPNIRHAPTIPRTTISFSTTQATTTSLTTTISPKKEAKIKENIASLPDEVPDDIREQLLSSGILSNADIQILDYDKVGGINIGDLPPEALANFYGSGGAAATAASEPIPQIAKRPKIMNQEEDELELHVSSSTLNISNNSIFRGKTVIRTEDVTLRPGGVEMKIVRFDPNTTQGQIIADQHFSKNATLLSPVPIEDHGSDDNSSRYNRYLPLKVSGASFPIPSTIELNGKKITSVVVLAPVDYKFQTKSDYSTRQNRKLANDIQEIRFLAGDSLKLLMKKPSAENYKRWLDQERQTEPQNQSVVLLVTMSTKNSENEKEIFMYDTSSEGVNKLAGDLSTAFVDVAESNSDINEDPTFDILSRTL